MSLPSILAAFNADISPLEVEIGVFVRGRPSPGLRSTFALRDECVLEGILSRVWQVWCKFCRDSIFESLLGTSTVSGTMIPRHPAALSAEHVSAAAINASKSRQPEKYWGAKNDSLRREPTWGDVDVLTDIVSRLSPLNAGQLLAAYSASWASAKALRTIRNASAHFNAQSMTEVQNLGTSYVTYPILHPTHAMFWAEPVSGDFLVTHAIHNLKSHGALSVQ